MKRPIYKATSEDIALMTYASDPRHYTGDNRSEDHFAPLVSQAQLDSGTVVYMPRPDACSDDLWKRFHERRSARWPIFAAVAVVLAVIIAAL